MADEKKEEKKEIKYKFILGQKLGMTQIFDKEGHCIPVTAVEAGPCYVVQIKSAEKDGYSAVKIGFGQKRNEKNLNKAHKGQFTKHDIKILDVVKEIRVDDASSFSRGQEIKADVFSTGDYVDVTGVSKAKGFAGTMKRHGFAGQPNSHGHTEYRRAPGSIGASSFPGRVFKGTRMAGRMGGETVTQQKLMIAGVHTESNLLLIRGAVPGHARGTLIIKRTIKKVPKPVESGRQESLDNAGKKGKRKGK